MATEIERKFLVNSSLWRPDPTRGVPYRQGYLSSEGARTVRVRVAGAQGFLTIKGPTTGITRLEFEYPIPLPDANQLLDTLCRQPLIEKVRYREPWQGFTWEVDIFEGENRGLVIAELELPTATTPFSRPPWLGEEVSGDPRYYNSALALRPYGRWHSS